MLGKEAAEKWGCSVEQVRTWCREGKIPGAEKLGNIWEIPDDAQKPGALTGQQEAQKEEKSDDKALSIAMIGLIVLGIALALLGGWMVLRSKIFFGAIFLLAGAGILTFFCDSFLPSVKPEIIFAVICVVAVLGSLLLFGAGSRSSSGRKWSDLSETEKANARWAYEAKQYIDSRD